MNSPPHPQAPDDGAPPTAVEAQALDWFFRQQHRALPARDQAAFEAWLAAAPDHAREYAQLQAVWRDMAQLPAAARQPLLNLALARAPVRARSTPTRSPWQWGAAFAACAVLALAAWAGYQHIPVESQALANGPREVRQLVLADGTRIRANVGTRLAVHYTLARREVRLERGEAFFEIGEDRRPFAVVSGTARIRDIGTEFNVLALPTLLQVGVKSGRVALTPDMARPGVERELGAGETASIDLAAGASAEPVVVQGAADAVGSWRDGILIVEAEPLARVLEKLARYRTGAVTLDGAVGTLQVSGTIDLRRPDAFLRALPDLLPGVQLHWQPDGAVSIGAARRS
ncbi:FecR family protein [Variovorax sp. UC122_21]|uniref:FecR family protein n=1 Tax=Variovorax sp. UC122_21 TaxID=3374554 RepID=UPI003756F6E2